MRIEEADLFGGSLRVVRGGDRSSVSVSLHPSEEASDQFGVLAYALPYKERTVASVLKSSTDQGVVDTALHVSKMLAALLQQPVFVNTTIRNIDALLLAEIKRHFET